MPKITNKKSTTEKKRKPKVYINEDEDFTISNIRTETIDKLLKFEEFNITNRIDTGQKTINKTITNALEHANLKVDIHCFEYSIDKKEYLKFIRNWKGLRKKPANSNVYYKKAISWLNGRRSIEYGRTLFPYMVEKAVKYCKEIAKICHPNFKDLRTCFENLLIVSVICDLYHAKVCTNDKAGDKALFPQNAFKEELGDVLISLIPSNNQYNNISALKKNFKSLEQNLNKDYENLLKTYHINHRQITKYSLMNESSNVVEDNINSTHYYYHANAATITDFKKKALENESKETGEKIFSKAKEVKKIENSQPKFKDEKFTTWFTQCFSPSIDRKNMNKSSFVNSSETLNNATNQEHNFYGNVMDSPSQKYIVNNSLLPALSPFPQFHANEIKQKHDLNTNMINLLHLQNFSTNDLIPPQLTSHVSFSTNDLIPPQLTSHVSFSANDLIPPQLTSHVGFSYFHKNGNDSTKTVFPSSQNFSLPYSQSYSSCCLSPLSLSGNVNSFPTIQHSDNHFVAKSDSTASIPLLQHETKNEFPDIEDEIVNPYVEHENFNIHEILRDISTMDHDLFMDHSI